MIKNYNQALTLTLSYSGWGLPPAVARWVKASTSGTDLYYACGRLRSTDLGRRLWQEKIRYQQYLREEYPD